ncbi:hypothetical protein LDENG_00248940 [Lucifuga dentata]|nr:hypothetical protein LDENG_00248940 [Lucifuga dentata]
MTSNDDDFRTIHNEEQVSIKLPVGVNNTQAEELLKLHRERDVVEAQLTEYIEGFEQKRKDLQERGEELMKDYEKRKPLLAAEMSRKEKEAEPIIKKAEKDKQEALQMDPEVERLKKELAELEETHKKISRSIQRFGNTGDVMERLLKMTEFKDVQELTGRFENLLITRDRFCQRESELEEKIDQQREVLQTYEHQHRMCLMGKYTQLTNLQTDLDLAWSKALTWERKWNEIETTASKKTFELHQMKTAVLRIYEMTGGKVGEKGVALNDTERQLEKIKDFIQDHDDICAK